MWVVTGILGPWEIFYEGPSMCVYARVYMTRHFACLCSKHPQALVFLLAQLYFIGKVDGFQFHNAHSYLWPANYHHACCQFSVE